MQATIDAVRRALFAAVLAVLALLCAAASATADTGGGGAPAPADKQPAVKSAPASSVVVVKRFQKRKGLAVDGVVGPDTRDALGLEPFARSSVKRESTGAKLPRILRQIAECESGGNPRAVSPGGQYRGKYQFSLETWHNLGGDGDPVDASEAEQDRIALKLYRRSGAAPWPNCP